MTIKIHPSRGFLNFGVRRALGINFVSWILVLANVAVASPDSFAQSPNSIANISFDPSASLTQVDEGNADSNFVGGADITFDWSSIEVTPGAFDFTSVDAKMKAWIKRGKKFAVIIRYLNERQADCGRNQRLPNWEAAKIRTLCDTNSNVIIPDYFDHTFKADLKRFIFAVGQHIAGDPSFKANTLYVRGGLGLGSESFYLPACNKTKSPACDETNNLQTLKTWGFTPHAWATWQIEMLITYQKAFPQNTIVYALNNLGLNPDTHRPIQMDVAYWAASKNMGIGALGLGPGFADGPAQIRTIMSTVRARHPETFLQLQTVGPVGDATTLQADIALAKDLGVHSVEWYASDLLNSDYQPIFNDWAQFNSPHGSGH